MKQIEQKLIQAIEKFDNWSSGNSRTYVSKDLHGNDILNIYLHDNLIAQKTLAIEPVRAKRATKNRPKIEAVQGVKSKIRVFDGGWRSNTTKSRLNAILGYFCNNMGVCQRNYEWFFTHSSAGLLSFENGQEFNTNL